MLDYKKGLCIAEYFRGILLEILKRTEDLIKRNVETKNVNHLNFSVTLSHLLNVYPYILPFVLSYFWENGPFFSQRMKTDEYVLIIETAFRLLSFSPSSFRGLWNWGILCEVNIVGSGEIMKSFIKTMSLVLNCTNKEISELRGEIYDSSAIAQGMAAEELCQARNGDCIVNENDIDADMNEVVFTEQDFLGAHTIVANVLVPRISTTVLSAQNLVVVPSTRKNVKALTLAIVSGKSVLICGAVGSGKTSLVEYFASLTGRDRPPYLFKVQLGDQTDSKVCLE
jgi:ABC-type multidrug transport system fused ATPase/permease subunit